MNTRKLQVLNILASITVLLYLAVDGYGSSSSKIRLLGGIFLVLSLCLWILKLILARNPFPAAIRVQNTAADMEKGNIHNALSFITDSLVLLGTYAPLLIVLRFIDPFLFVLYGYEYGHLFTIIERIVVDFAATVLLVLSVGRFFGQIGSDTRVFCEKWSHVLSVLFYILFAYVFLNRALNSTMFRETFANASLPSKLFRLSVSLLLLLAVFTAGTQKKHLHWAFMTAILTTGFFHYKIGGQRHLILVMCILIVAAAGKNAKTILWISAVAGAAAVLTTLAAMNQGFLLNLTSYSIDMPDVPRYALGFISPTDCAAHLLYLLIIWCVLHADCTKSVLNLDFFVMVFFLFIAQSLNHARTNAMLIAVVMVLTLFHRFWLILHASDEAYGHGQTLESDPRFSRFRLHLIPAYIAALSFPLCFAFSYFMSKTYAEGEPFLFESFLGRFISPKSYSDRLLYASRALAQYPLSLFGIDITEHGNGGMITHPTDYSFIDISYIRVLLAGGILITILLLTAMTYLQLRAVRARQFYILALLSIIAVNCLIEHHLSEFCYNVWPVLLLASHREET